MKQEIIVKEKEIEVIPYWKSASFWMIRNAINQIDRQERKNAVWWEFILFAAVIILLTWIGSGMF